MAAKDMDWLDNKHEVWEARHEEWERGEARLAGGTDVLPELWPFEWESVETDSRTGGIRLTTTDATRDIHTKDVVLGNSGEKIGEHYSLRQRSATYINFPDMYAMAMVGQILRAKPEVDYGTLGLVDRADGQVDPSRAELFHYNADGVGNDGSQFWNFVRHCANWAAAGTGHVWVMVEVPSQPAATFADEIAGARPFLRMFRAGDVEDWHYVEGRLAYLKVRVPMRSPKVVNGKMTGAKGQDGYYLLVRRGWQGFDGSEPGGVEKFSNGGWFLFDGDKTLVDQGDWSKTGGEIPCAALYYQRSAGTKAGGPAISRCGAIELGACAVSYMNLSSAADYDVWDGAGSLQIIKNASPEAFNTMISKIRGGNKYVPLQADPITKTAPEIHDASTGVVAADAFRARLDAKREEAKELAALEATSVPDSSGVSKAAGFAEAKAPRLALMASEIEQCFNAVLRWVELRWGRATPPGQGTNPPRAVIRMPKDFDLRDTLADIDRYFDIQTKSKLRSKTVDAKAMTRAAVETGIITDNETDDVEAEYGQSSDDLAASEAALTAFGAGAGGGLEGGGGGPPAPPEAD